VRLCRGGLRRAVGDGRPQAQGRQDLREDLGLINDPEGAVFIPHGLLRKLGQADDGETAMSEADLFVRRNPHTSADAAAADHAVSHANHIRYRFPGSATMKP